MKRECKQHNDDYQIWSGTDTTANPKKRGTYIVYWKGMELKRFRYMDEAQGCIAAHRRNREAEYTPKPKPLTPETEVWLDRLL